ncbi:hypothetical protein [Fusibacter bizertensis]
MKKNERMLYQKNNLGQMLILFSIMFNVIYSIFVLNHMYSDWKLGLFVFVTIILLLFGFLVGSKVLLYSKEWGYVAVGIGIFQFFRVFIENYDFDHTLLVLLNLCLVASALTSLVGGGISVRRAIVRKQVMDQSSNKQHILST